MAVSKIASSSLGGNALMLCRGLRMASQWCDSPQVPCWTQHLPACFSYKHRSASDHRHPAMWKL